MDPLSVTSGIVGIVAFAFQLAKTASKVRTAVEEMKSAPKEARDLVERLVMLETACQVISVHLERRRALPNHSLLSSFDIISKPLAQLLAKAQELEQMLSNLTSGNGTTRKIRPISDTASVSRLRLVLRKDKINSLVQDIERVINLLHFAIQVDMWTSTPIPQQLPCLSSNGTELIDETLKLGGISRIVPRNPVLSQRTRTACRARNQRCRTFRYLGYITWTMANGWVGEDDGDDTSRIAFRRGSIIVQLPCTSTRINIHYDTGLGTPSYALNVVHIIEDNSDLGMRLWKLMEPGNDQGKLHEMVSKRELSIYSSFRSSMSGKEMNLFFMAVVTRWAEGCRYLLQHDFRHEFEEANTPPVMCFKSDPGDPYEVTEIFLSVRPQDMLETDMNYLLGIIFEPEPYIRHLEVFMESPGIDRANFLSHAWDSLLPIICFFLGKGFEAASEWIPVLQYFIEHGIDTHQLRNQYGNSAYAVFLSSREHPLDADDVAHTWLKMLKTCGVDLSSYIEAETALIQQLGLDHPVAGGRRRSIVLLDYDGLQIPSWRWCLPTESNAVEAFAEFMNFNFELGEDRVLVYPTGPDDFKVWDRHLSWWSFPFHLSQIECIAGKDDYRLDGLWCRATYNRAVEIRDERFARRQARKWRKAHPGEKPPLNKMPGTWVD